MMPRAMLTHARSWIVLALAGASLSSPALCAEQVVTASLVVKVHQKEAAMDDMLTAAREAGGWFSSLSDDRLVLRVPAAEVDDLVEAVVARGVVVDRQYTRVDKAFDLETIRTRLASREEMLGQYLELLATADPKAVLTVERQVVRLVEEIERMKGQLRALEDRVAHGTVDVHFRFQDRSAPVATGDSPFAWLGTVDLGALMEDFHRRSSEAARRCVSGPVPEGFALFKEGSARRGVSPDGVVYRLRTERHRPQADLEFWSEALKRRMLEAGYTFMDDGPLTVDGVDGYRVELTAPMGEEDHSYMVVIFPVGRRVVIVEAAGEVSRFEDQRQVIMDAIDDVSM